MKQKIEIEIDIPKGYEFVRIGPADEGELYLDEGYAFLSVFNSRISRIIVRKIKQWRDPVLPADYGKMARFSHDGEEWLNFKLLGWNDNYFSCVGGGLFKFCQVCDEECFL